MIRLAGANDKITLVRMARDFHALSGMPFPFSAPHASLCVDACIAGGDYAAFVYEKDGKARGVLGSYSGVHVYAPCQIANEIMFWIDPEYRGGSAAVKLIRAYEAWAKSRGCMVCELVGLGNDPSVGNLYARLGYSPAEKHFLKVL